MKNTRINMQFKDTYEGGLAYAFLNKVKSRKKSQFVACLISDWLKEYGIESLKQLDELSEGQLEEIMEARMIHKLGRSKSENSTTSELIDVIKMLVNTGEIRPISQKQELLPQESKESSIIKEVNLVGVINEETKIEIEEEENQDVIYDFDSMDIDDSDLEAALGAFS